MNILKKIKKSSFVKSIMILSSGTVLAQVVTILLTPVLTRMFSPTEFGLYAIIITAESIFGGVICARYDISIVNEPVEQKIFPLIKLSFIISVLTSIIFGLIYGGYYFFYREGYQDYSYLITFIILGLFLNGLLRILESVNNRYREYKYMSLSYVYRTLVQNFGAITIGLFFANAFALIFSHVFGLLFGFRTQYTSLKGKTKQIIKVPTHDLLIVAKKYYRQPLYSSPAVLMNRISFGGIIIFIEFLYGVATLGIYTIANKFLGIPITVLSNNVSKVFYKEASDEYHITGKFFKTLVKTTIVMTLLSIPLFTLIYIFAPYFLELLLGKQWAEAGNMIRVLSPLFAIRLIVGSIANGLQIAQKQKFEFIIQILFVIALISSYFLSFNFGFAELGFLQMIVITFGLVYLIFYLYVLVVSLKKTGGFEYK